MTEIVLRAGSLALILKFLYEALHGAADKDDAIIAAIFGAWADVLKRTAP